MCFSKPKRLRIPFGVPYFSVYDKDNVCSEIAVRGNVNILAKNYEKFLKGNGYEDTSLSAFENEIKSAIIPCVKQAVANAPKRYKLTIYQLNCKTEQIAREIKGDLAKILKKRYKVKLVNIEITAMESL